MYIYIYIYIYIYMYIYIYVFIFCCNLQQENNISQMYTKQILLTYIMIAHQYAYLFRSSKQAPYVILSDKLYVKSTVTLITTLLFNEEPLVFL